MMMLLLIIALASDSCFQVEGFALTVRLEPLALVSDSEYGDKKLLRTET
jgi:hypothetical protein